MRAAFCVYHWQHFFTPVYLQDMQDITSFISKLNYLVSLGGLIGIVVLSAWLIYIIVSVSTKKTPKILIILSEYILPLGFFITLGGMLMSLYYSDFLLVVPCVLCWYQRIFMYAQVFLFGYAWYRKDRTILPYTLLLSGVGFVIAGYHHMLQIGYDIYKPCSSAPFSVDCAKPTFIEFGFVTFPFLALVLFSFIILLMITAKYFAKR